MFKIFKKPDNTPELKGEAGKPRLPDGEFCVTCDTCKKTLFLSDLKENYSVCPKCGFHHKISPRERLRLLTDGGSFNELFAGLTSRNIINFPGYNEKLLKATELSGEEEGIVCGTARIGGAVAAVFVMNADFMMGSMGTVVGEKITLLFEYAAEHKLPIVGFTVSGGARMQEGILSLMQMAKTAAAVRRHGEAGNLYITVLTNPTTGGVTASFAMLGDIILAEPGALVGFAGPRVIEQTIRQKLPAGFQSAEFLLSHGFIDKIVPRGEQNGLLSRLLRLHGGETE
jgi:acetyl-CoA carboxylase carboxyl transferase subunit beta